MSSAISNSLGLGFEEGERSMQDAQFLRISIETIIILAVTLFVPAVSAAWVLLHALVFRPLSDLKEEVSKMNENFKEEVSKLNGNFIDQSTEIRLLRQLVDRHEDEIRTLQGEVMRPRAEA